VLRKVLKSFSSRRIVLTDSFYGSAFRVDVPCNGKKNDALTFNVLINLTFHSDGSFIPLKLKRERLCEKGLNPTIPSEEMTFFAESPKDITGDFARYIDVAILLVIIVFAFIWIGIHIHRFMGKSVDGKLM